MPILSRYYKYPLFFVDDPNIRWVAYNININKEFRAFEAGQLSALANIPEQGQWSYEFQRNLKDGDLVYVWLGIQYNNVVFRDKQGPISVEAVRRGDRNVIVAPPRKLGSSSSSTSTTTTTTKKPSIATKGPVPEPDKLCYPTVTVASITGKFCKGDMLFEDKFDELLPNRWTNEVRIPPDTGDSEFVVYNGTARVEGGILKLPASFYKINVLRGTIDLDNRYDCIHHYVKKKLILTTHTHTLKGRAS